MKNITSDDQILVTETMLWQRVLCIEKISTCQGCPDKRSFASPYVQILPRNDCSTSRRRCPTGLLAAEKGGLLRKHVIDEQNATAVDIVNLLRIRLDSPILVINRIAVSMLEL